MWKKIVGGCRLNLPSVDLIRAEGFDLTHLDTGYMGGPKPMAYMYEGSAKPC
jgi:hypothetical protein